MTPTKTKPADHPVQRLRRAVVTGSIVASTPPDRSEAGPAVYPGSVSLVRLEGIHAIKHAHRFEADIRQILTDDLDRALAIADQVAPELRPVLVERAHLVSPAELRQSATGPTSTHLLAWAERPVWHFDQGLPRPDSPTVLLDDPRNAGNLGAVIRVAAAAGAAGVWVNGTTDPCSPMAIRGAAGLQWALPTWSSPDVLVRLDQAQADGGVSLVGLDADGDTFDPAGQAGPTVFAFGSERAGLSDDLRRRCHQIVALPMRPHVSSLNLATSVAAVLYLRAYARSA